MKPILFLLLSMLPFTLSAQKPYQLSGNEVIINKPITFKTASAELTKESDEALLIIKQYLDEKPYITLLRVEGHTNNATANAQNLSEKRALAICQKLVSLGIDCKRLIAVGFGETKPIAENSTAEGRAKNTRITFVNIALRDRLIGGIPADGGGVMTGKLCL